MVKSKETITLYDLPAFTKVSLETPVEDLSLPSEACYMYITKGDGQLVAKKENITLETGHVILSLCGYTASKMIAEQTKGAVESIIVHFNQSLLQKVFEGTKPELWTELEKPVTQYIVQASANALVKHYFSGITELFQNKEALTPQILQLKLKEIIYLLLQSGNAENIRQIVLSLFSERTFTFKELVSAHIENTTSIENLAMVTNCSISTFKRRFKEVFDATPNQYIINLKVEKVAYLLKTTDEPISTIGYQCGFNSPEHLSRAFKNKYHLTPSAYRLNFSIK